MNWKEKLRIHHQCGPKWNLPVLQVRRAMVMVAVAWKRNKGLREQGEVPCQMVPSPWAVRDQIPACRSRGEIRKTVTEVNTGKLHLYQYATIAFSQKNCIWPAYCTRMVSNFFPLKRNSIYCSIGQGSIFSALFFSLSLARILLDLPHQVPNPSEKSLVVFLAPLPRNRAEKRVPSRLLRGKLCFFSRLIDFNPKKRSEGQKVQS